MDLAAITPFLLTLDEEPNVGRALERLTWARRVLVVDSGSADRTVAIARGFPNVDVLVRPFDSFAGQSDFALAAVETPWALALDADYLVPEGLVAEIRALPDDPAESGFFAPFRYRVLGRTLRASLYPPRQVLFRAAAASFAQDGHAHRVRVAGRSGRLRTPIVHDDRKGLDRWLASQAAYAEQEAAKLSATPATELGWIDRLRRTVVLGPPAVTAWCLLGKGLFLDGRAGLYYTAQRGIAEALLSLALLERRREGR